jgi:hypothetical protein
MQRGHSDDDGGAPERNRNSNDRKPYAGKGKNRAKQPVQRVVEEVEEVESTLGESSGGITEPVPAPGGIRPPPPASGVVRFTRSVKKKATFSFFVNMPMQMFRLIAFNLPLSRLFMFRCTSRVFHDMFMDTVPDDDDRMVLWHAACLCMTVSLPMFVSAVTLRETVARMCPCNSDCMFHIKRLANTYFTDWLETPRGEQFVRYRDLFPGSEGTSPKLFGKWKSTWAAGQLLAGHPTDTIATLRHAGFFCTKRSRERLIKLLLPDLKMMRRPCIFAPSVFLPLYGLIVDLATESFGASFMHVDSRLWRDGADITSIVGRGPSFMLLVDVRREDLDRLNAKYGLHMKFDF